MQEKAYRWICGTMQPDEHETGSRTVSLAGGKSLESRWYEQSVLADRMRTDVNPSLHVEQPRTRHVVERRKALTAEPRTRYEGKVLSGWFAAQARSTHDAACALGHGSDSKQKKGNTEYREKIPTRFFWSDYPVRLCLMASLMASNSSPSTFQN